MKEYIREFCDRYGIIPAHREVLVGQFEKIEENKELLSLLEKSVGILYEDVEGGYEAFSPFLRKIDETLETHRYITDLLFFICASSRLPGKYEKAGIPQEICADTLADIAYKYGECVKVYGIPGLFTEGWQCGFLTMGRFALGRMQYERSSCGFDFPSLGIRKGDPAIGFHIPEGGGPFDREARAASYEKAYYFYRDLFPDGRMVLATDSWLIFPEHRDFLKGCPNILDFMDDFDLIVPEGKGPGDLWRIFRTKSLNIEEFPKETSLQRSYYDFMKSGGVPGTGYGVIVIEGPESIEKILARK